MTRCMHALLLCGAAAAAAPALAGSTTLLSCAEGERPVTSWTVLGATRVCHQTVVGSPLDSGRFSARGERVAAFQDNLLLGIRPGDEENPAPIDMPDYRFDAWNDTGTTGVLGELWWGRTGDRHIFLGQESRLRLTKLSTASPAVIPALRDYSMRMTMAMVQRRPMVHRPGDEPFMLFQKDHLEYVQHAATTVTFTGGLGGTQITPARPTNARLELDTRPVPKGVLRFELVIDGQTRQFAIPLRAESEQHHLRARVSLDDNALACNGEEDYMLRPGTCLIPDSVAIGTGAPPMEFYTGEGAFFGDHAYWAAIHYRLILNSPAHNRKAAWGTGVLILKLKQPS